MICSSLKIYSFIGSQYCEIKASKFYSFGSLLTGRVWSPTSTDKYRFGFNGKEMDNETFGDGNEMDFGDRIYDSRIGRWLSIDPFFKKYAYLSPYVACANNPISLVDIGGDSTAYYTLSGVRLAKSNDSRPDAIVIIDDETV